MPTSLLSPPTETESIPSIQFANPTGLKLDHDFEKLLSPWQKDDSDHLLDDDLAYHSEKRRMLVNLDREDAIESGSRLFWGKVILEQKRWINSSGKEYRRTTTINPTSDSFTRSAFYRVGPHYDRWD